MVKKSSDIISEIHEFGISYETREIFIFNDFVDNNTAQQFIKNLRVLEHSKNLITIHQLSWGGDTNAGMAIYDAIKHSNSKFLFITYGLAASMGALIPQAVHNKGLRITMPSCVWLVHEGSIGIEDNRQVVRSYLDADKLFLEKMYDIYAIVCQNSEYFSGDKQSTIKGYIKRKLQSKQDWWLSSSDALTYGLCDGIFGEGDYTDLKTIQGLI